MRIAACVLGILGGLGGIGGALVVLFATSIAWTVNFEHTGEMANHGLAAVFCGILGIVGGALAPSRPKAAAWLQAISAVGGLIAISAFYIVGTACLGFGAILSWIAGRQRVQVPAQTGTNVSA